MSRKPGSSTRPAPRFSDFGTPQRNGGSMSSEIDDAIRVLEGFADDWQEVPDQTDRSTQQAVQRLCFAGLVETRMDWTVLQPDPVSGEAVTFSVVATFTGNADGDWINWKITGVGVAAGLLSGAEPSSGSNHGRIFERRPSSSGYTLRQRMRNGDDAAEREVRRRLCRADSEPVITMVADAPSADTPQESQNSSDIRSDDVKDFIAYYNRTKKPGLSDNDVARNFAKSRGKFMEESRAINILTQVRKNHRDKLKR